MTRTISWGISNLEDIEVLIKEETEETVKMGTAQGSNDPSVIASHIAIYKPIDIEGPRHINL